MKIEQYQANNIVVGQARIMGGVVQYSNQPAWILPGGFYTLNIGRANEMASQINRMLQQK